MPQIEEEQTVVVVKVIPEERCWEPPVEQIVDVPVIAKQLTRVRRDSAGVRTLELQHQSQLTFVFTQKNSKCDTGEVSEKTAALSQAKG